MAETTALTKIRTGCGGLGWRTIVRGLFIGLLLFIRPNWAHALGRFPYHMEDCPRRGLLKGAQESPLPSSEIDEAEHCAPKHTTRYMA